MGLLERIGRLTAAPGATGLEEGVAAQVLRELQAMGAEAWQGQAGNVYGRVGPSRGGPVVLLMAHMDEVGMAVQAIEENGMLRLCKIAGVDPRVLPGARLVIQGREGPLWAVAGALPPHLQKKEEAYTWEDILCDTGLEPARARALVRPGDPVTFAPEPPLALLDGRVASKTLDDRGPLAALLELFEGLCQAPPPCQVVLCASCQEEKSGAGAMAAARAIKPDMALAVDVCHAPPPKTPFRAFPLEELVLCRSASLHPGLFALVEAAAKEAGVSYQLEAAMAASGTDAWDIAVQNGGVATGLISVPLRYMHTGVEVISLQALGSLQKTLEVLLRGFSGQGAAWKEALCWND